MTGWQRRLLQREAQLFRLVRRGPLHDLENSVNGLEWIEIERRENRSVGRDPLRRSVGAVLHSQQTQRAGRLAAAEPHKLRFQVEFGPSKLGVSDQASESIRTPGRQHL